MVETITRYLVKEGPTTYGNGYFKTRKIAKKAKPRKEGVLTANDWFVEPEKEPRRKAYKGAVSTAGIKRLMKNVDEFENNWPKNNLYASSIGDPNWSLGENLIDFWLPPRKKADIFKELYCQQSNVKHKIWQHWWFKSGLTHPLHGKRKFEEVRMKIPEWGISGRIDLILPDEAYLSNLVATKPKDDVERKSWVVGDIKETGSRNYKEAQDFLSEKYRTQLTLYHKWAVFNGISKKDDPTFFFYLERDNPTNFKWITYEPEEELLEKVEKRANTFWKHVQDRTHPEIEDFSDFCGKAIKSQPERDWNPLAKVGQVQKELF